MEINIDYIANLARLELTQQEKEKYSKQISQILEYVQKLNELDTSDVLPTSHPKFTPEKSSEYKNVWRQDKTKPSKNTDDLLSIAPQKEATYFKVPKIIE